MLLALAHQHVHPAVGTGPAAPQQSPSRLSGRASPTALRVEQLAVRPPDRVAQQHLRHGADIGPSPVVLVNGGPAQFVARVAGNTPGHGGADDGAGREREHPQVLLAGHGAPDEVRIRALGEVVAAPVHPVEQGGDAVRVVRGRVADLDPGAWPGLLTDTHDVSYISALPARSASGGPVSRRGESRCLATRERSGRARRDPPAALQAGQRLGVGNRKTRDGLRARYGAQPRTRCPCPRVLLHHGCPEGAALGEVLRDRLETSERRSPPQPKRRKRDGRGVSRIRSAECPSTQSPARKLGLAP